MDKREEGVEASIYTQQVSNQFKLDLAKHDKQYPAIGVHLFKKAHDRFLIIDDTVYLVGASIKDLGKKWFGITTMSATHPNELIAKLNDEEKKPDETRKSPKHWARCSRSTFGNPDRRQCPVL